MKECGCLERVNPPRELSKVALSELVKSYDGESVKRYNAIMPSVLGNGQG
jgi:hypothetical protein